MLNNYVKYKSSRKDEKLWEEWRQPAQATGHSQFTKLRCSSWSLANSFLSPPKGLNPTRRGPC